jgi:hypothetical protein
MAAGFAGSPLLFDGCGLITTVSFDGWCGLRWLRFASNYESGFHLEPEYGQLSVAGDFGDFATLATLRTL